MGSEGFFLVFFSVIYWSVNKSLGFWGLVIMPLSILLTSEILKEIVRLPRPDVRGITVPTYTFPSGHTSGAVSVWGFLAMVLQKRWLWALSLVIISLVAVSRIMLGYHYPGDVIGGIITGTMFLALLFGVGTKLLKKRVNITLPYPALMFLALAVPLLISFIPVTYAPNLTGYLAGAVVGYLPQKKTLNFHTQGNWQQHLARMLIGLPVLAAIVPGLGIIVPPDNSLLIFFQHALSTFWVMYLAPLLFIKYRFA